MGAGAQAQFYAGPACGFGVLPQQVGQPLTQVHHLVFGQQPAVIQGVEIENGAEQLRDVEQRTVDIVHQPPLLIAQPRFTQARRKQADGVDGLAQIMAGLGEEARLFQVGGGGLFRRLARALQQQVGVDRDHRAGNHQHQHHKGLRLPQRGQPIHNQQRQQRQARGNRQVARAIAHAIAQVDPDHHRIQRQCRLAADYQAERGAGVVVDHPENPSRRVMPGPACNHLTQHNRDQQKQANINNHRHIAVHRLPRQKAQQADVHNGADGHHNTQVGLVQFGVFHELHGQRPCTVIV